MSGRSKSIPVAELKMTVAKAIAEGSSVEQAVARVGRTVSAYERWRREDPVWAQKLDEFRGMRKHQRGEKVSFPVFSEKYLGMRVFPHMQNVVDIVEGRRPGWTPAGIVWDPGERDLAIVNMPPEHG